MAGKTGSQAPSSVADGLNGIVQAISAAMTAPDAGPHLPLFEQLLKATVGAIQKGNQPQPPQGGPPGGAPGGAPPGGGAMAGGLPGMGGGGPSAGPQGGPSPSGASADDIRRMVGAQAGTAG